MTVIYGQMICVHIAASTGASAAVVAGAIAIGGAVVRPDRVQT